MELFVCMFCPVLCSVSEFKMEFAIKCSYELELWNMYSKFSKDISLVNLHVD